MSKTSYVELRPYGVFSMQYSQFFNAMHLSLNFPRHLLMHGNSYKIIMVFLVVLLGQMRLELKYV